MESSLFFACRSFELAAECCEHDAFTTCYDMSDVCVCGAARKSYRTSDSARTLSELYIERRTTHETWAAQHIHESFGIVKRPSDVARALCVQYSEPLSAINSVLFFTAFTVLFIAVFIYFLSNWQWVLFGSASLRTKSLARCRRRRRGFVYKNFFCIRACGSIQRIASIASI